MLVWTVKQVCGGIAELTWLFFMMHSTFVQHAAELHA